MEHAECVVVFPATELFAELRRIEEWPRFVEGLQQVEHTGHHRYRWHVTYAGNPRLVDVVVSFDHRRRRISWKSLHRPSFDGGLRLVPLDAHRTRVHCWLSVEPVGLVETLMTGPQLTSAMAARNLQRLTEWVAARPQPGPVGGVGGAVPVPRIDLDGATVRSEA